MGFVKDHRFWGGVIVGVLFYYVYANHLKGRSMG